MNAIARVIRDIRIQMQKEMFFVSRKNSQKEETIDWNTYIAIVHDIREFIHAGDRLFFWTGIHTHAHTDDCILSSLTTYSL